MKEWKEKGSRDTAVRSEHSDVAKAPVCKVRSQDDRVSRGHFDNTLVCRHVLYKECTS